MNKHLGGPTLPFTILCILLYYILSITIVANQVHFAKIYSCYAGILFFTFTFLLFQ